MGGSVEVDTAVVAAEVIGKDEEEQVVERIAENSDTGVELAVEVCLFELDLGNMAWEVVESQTIVTRRKSLRMT